MSDDDTAIGETPGFVYLTGDVPELVEKLEREPRDVDHCTQRIELASAQTLGALERAIQAKAEALMKAAAIVSLHPSFRWWIVAGYWARPADPGFSVLLRLANFSGGVPAQGLAAGGRR
jgi:hypothetical protein